MKFVPRRYLYIHQPLAPPFFCHALLAPHVEQRNGAVRTEQCCIEPCGACCAARLCRVPLLIGFPDDIISHIFGCQRSPAVHRAAAIQRAKFQAPGLAGVPDATRRDRALLSLSYHCLHSPYPHLRPRKCCIMLDAELNSWGVILGWN